MTISSSLPLASHLPECAHRTVRTGPVCMVRVHSDFGGLFKSSEAGLRIGFVLHIRILASSPPVAILEPSGCTCTEKIERRLVVWSLLAESLCMTQAGLVKCIVNACGSRYVLGNQGFRRQDQGPLGLVEENSCCVLAEDRCNDPCGLGNRR